MKHITLSLLLSVSVSLSAIRPIKMGVITDTHYLSEQLMDGGYAVQNYVLVSGKNIKDTPAVLDKVLADYLNSDIEVLLICGDMSKDGEKQSHLDLVKKLKPLQDRGVKVYVIPGNHDINMPNAVEYKGNKTLPVANVSPREFTDIYAACGYKDAIRRDTASLSYVAQLGEDTWLLAIDAARYEEYKGYTVSGGKISAATEKWIVDVLDEAKAKNIQVIGMMHWGLTEHIIYQSMFFKEYLVDDWNRLANLFADKGMKVIFTGHFHSNDISSFRSDKGNIIYDIETGTLSAYPFSYRYVDLYADRIDIRTENVTAVPGNPNLASEDKDRMQSLARQLALQKIKNLGYDFSQDVKEQFADVLSQIFVLHAFGDEKPDDQLKASVEKLSKLMESPMDLDDMQLDFPPADNNIEITF
ncbi:3',5'-cyclic AMP phosphodiesterase CpdA [Dysgonomonas sp. PFB1-18]|uniref:metallophosphoesterase family protein n=1 Tax=unclassified Dysgonomonas TaxID=2630389 RepID=UPI0024756CD3|nr:MULTISPECIES: metallophosphoesterase [unclassified Dysgonomonas]MDH6308440.1 3',5'-cyclic AMP phosphodiesterase CpdA [Dysgonomonas sp. PF1-14]MDH6337941.1 3',5'-cyclic AMP phosphodiesterase CpdA [Dysgonomonas sp. PF1-16]MDH6379438.1 3',5'-cyclic AMP phosphodiesterase CpdA [Dysgonomonas sp. PFB1-18]MDH6396769.1 3',5'-cyclic AMP phosphodiesterase CpdA [Dysgonomonas sp. PF1-23]